MIYHQTGYVHAAPHPLFELLKTGYMAVGVFFTLSGFILAYNHSLDHAWNFDEIKRFALGRFARIYPVYVLGLLLVLPFQIRGLIQHPVNNGSLGALQFVLLQAWAPAATGKWNSPGWSLSNEAFFYSMFPFLGVALCQNQVSGICWCGVMGVRHVGTVPRGRHTPLFRRYRRHGGESPFVHARPD